MPRPVIIAEYDHQWPILYAEEERLILGVVGHRVLVVEHIGSTAVPGLGAKPIIDMMAGVHRPSDADDCVPLLREIGYTDVTPEPEDPDGYYCLGKGPHRVGYHLHLARFMSDHWEKHLLFRDYLRAHPEVAQQYYEVKKKLATTYRSDRETYTEAKTSFIESVIAQARQQHSPLT